MGFLDCGLQCGGWNVVINRLTEMMVVNGVVEDDIPNGLQQVAVRFGRLGDLVLIVFEGLPGTCREARQTSKMSMLSSVKSIRVCLSSASRIG